ncbi:MAG: patatin-like phospholipase family protein, partial [Acidobacteriota bacterium]
LIVLPTGYACALDKPPKGAIASALHAITLLIARQLLSELQELDSTNVEYFVLPPLCPLTGSPYDFSQTDALIERAIKSTDQWIADGGLEHPNLHAQLSIHTHRTQH